MYSLWFKLARPVWCSMDGIGAPSSLTQIRTGVERVAALQQKGELVQSQAIKASKFLEHYEQKVKDDVSLRQQQGTLPAGTEEAFKTFKGALDRIEKALVSGKPIDANDLKIVGSKAQTLDKILDTSQPVDKPQVDGQKILQDTDTLIKQHNPEAPLEDQVRYLQALEQQAGQLAQLDGTLPAVQQAEKALTSQIETVLTAVQAASIKTSKDFTGETFGQVVAAYTLIREPIAGLVEGRDRYDQVGKQAQQVEDRLYTVKERAQEALVSLGIKEAAHATVEELVEILKGLTPERVAELQQAVAGGEPAQVTAAMQSLAFLQTAQKQIESLMEAGNALGDYEDALSKTIRDELNGALTKVGSPALITDATRYSETSLAISELQEKLGVQGYHGDPETLAAIEATLKQREVIAQHIINNTLISTGYMPEDIKKKGVVDLSNEGMARGITQLRSELGLPNTPPGKFSPEEQKELDTLAEKGAIDKPQTRLLQKILDRQKNMAVLDGDDMKGIRFWIDAQIKSNGGPVTADQLLTSVSKNRGGGYQRDLTLQLFSPDENGKLVPNQMLKMMMSKDGTISLDGIDKFRKYVDMVGGQIPVGAFKDVRYQAETLHTLISVEGLIVGKADKNDILSNLRNMSSQERMWLAVTYKVEHGVELTQALASVLEPEDLGEALHYLGRKDIPQVKSQIANPGGALQFLHDETNKDSITTRFNSAKELQGEAKEVFDKFHKATDPDVKAQLTTRFMQLWAGNQAQFQLKDQLVSRGVDQVEVLGFQVYTNEIDWTEVSKLKNEAQALYQQYLKEPDPGRKQKLLSDMLDKTAQAKDVLEMQRKRKAVDLDKFIDKLETYKEVTKTVAVIAATTAVGVFTFGAASAMIATLIEAGHVVGAGTAAVFTWSASFVAGTVGGTSMGYVTEAYDQWMTTGRIDEDKLAAKTSQHFNTAFTTAFGIATGSGFARLTQVVDKATKGSKFLNAVATTVTDYGGAAVTSAASDTIGRVGSRQDLRGDRAGFAAIQGMFLQRLGGGMFRQSLQGPATEVAWSAWSGEPTDLKQGLITGLAVSMLTRGKGKKVKQQTDTPDPTVKKPPVDVQETAPTKKPPVDVQETTPTKKSVDVEETTAPTKKPVTEEVEGVGKKPPVVEDTPTLRVIAARHQDFAAAMEGYQKRVNQIIDELKPIAKKLEPLEPQIQELNAKYRKLQRELEAENKLPQKDKAKIDAIKEQMKRVTEEKKPLEAEAEPYKNMRTKLVAEYNEATNQTVAKERDHVKFAKENLSVKEAAAIESKHGLDPLDVKRVDEIRQRTGAPEKQNVGFADVDIKSIPEKTMEAVSGKPKAVVETTQVPPDFKPLDVFDTGGNPRIYDSEYKILNDLAQRLKPGDTGTIRLFTERPCCASCNAAVRDFQQRFSPGIKLEIYYGDKPLT